MGYVCMYVLFMHKILNCLAHIWC